MISNVVILTLNDLAISLKNKTFYLILFIPLFVFVTFQLLDENESSVQKINIGLLEQGNYPPAMIKALESATDVFEISWLTDKTQWKQWLSGRQVDGILVPRGSAAEDTTLLVVSKASLQTAVIMDYLAGMQRVHEQSSREWIAEITPLQQGGMQLQMLPTWILMLVLLVSFIILPAQVAEEKEKKLLLGLLQTPIHELEWLLAKICFGGMMIVMATVFLQLLTGGDYTSVGIPNYLVFLLAGGFCFSALGVFIGFLCRTQASARTLGVIFYLPHLLPSALADFSKSLSGLAPLLPSYQFYRPIKSILLEGGAVSGFLPELLFLVILGLVAMCLSYQLMKKRWLM